MFLLKKDDVTCGDIVNNSQHSVTKETLRAN